MALKTSRLEAEAWTYRADVTEQAIRNRHAVKLWGLPGTNLTMVSWPAPLRHKAFINWHYWRQAQHPDYLVDAAKRVLSKEKYHTIRQVTRGIRIRNLTSLTENKYYGGHVQIALALGHADAVLGVSVPKETIVWLISCLGDGRQGSIGMLPWREQNLFLNIPSNDPATIALARAGCIKEVEELIDRAYASLPAGSGLLCDGIYLSMVSTVVQRSMFTYNQGVMIGACFKMGPTLRVRDQHEQATKYFTRMQNLIHAAAKDLATTNSIITDADGGDGGLFNGILV